jgi:hypothetical protein
MATSMIRGRMDSATTVSASIENASTVGLALLTFLTADEKSVIASNSVKEIPVWTYFNCLSLFLIRWMRGTFFFGDAVIGATPAALPSVGATVAEASTILGSASCVGASVQLSCAS